MKTENEILLLKKKALMKARITSIVLGLAAVVAVLSMVYGFTQNIEATRQRELSITWEQLSESLKLENLALKEQLEFCQSEKK